MSESWKLKGDHVMACNCAMFCPCVISLGQHAPTEGYRQTRAGIRIEGDTRDFDIAKVIEGGVKPTPGKQAGEHVVIRNTGYWVAPDVTVARAEKSRVRAFGRNWNFAGRSAEPCRLDWSNG